MKTQFSFNQYGFTMVEIMVVIAIIWSLFVLMSRINFNPQENIVKAERLASKVQSIIHLSNVSVMMWKMDNSTPPKATTGAIININASWSASSPNSVMWQLTPSLSGTFQAPFFDSDTKYEIQSIKWCVWWTTAAISSGTTTTLQILIDKNGTTFTWTTWSFPTTSNIVEIQVRYIDMAKKVVFDKRTGRIETRRSGEDLCN